MAELCYDPFADATTLVNAIGSGTIDDLFKEDKIKTARLVLGVAHGIAHKLDSLDGDDPPVIFAGNGDQVLRDLAGKLEHDKFAMAGPIDVIIEMLIRKLIEKLLEWLG